MRIDAVTYVTKGLSLDASPCKSVSATSKSFLQDLEDGEALGSEFPVTCILILAMHSAKLLIARLRCSKCIDGLDYGYFCIAVESVKSIPISAISREKSGHPRHSRLVCLIAVLFTRNGVWSGLVVSK